MSIEVLVSEGDEVRSLSQEEPSIHFSIDAKGMRVAFIDGQVIKWPKGKTTDDWRIRRRLVQIEGPSRTSLDP